MLSMGLPLVGTLLGSQAPSSKTDYSWGLSQRVYVITQLNTRGSRLTGYPYKISLEQKWQHVPFTERSWSTAIILVKKIASKNTFFFYFTFRSSTVFVVYCFFAGVLRSSHTYRICKILINMIENIWLYCSHCYSSEETAISYSETYSKVNQRVYAHVVLIYCTYKCDPRNCSDGVIPCTYRNVSVWRDSLFTQRTTVTM